MRTVQHILERKSGDVAHIDADASVLDAAHLMNRRRIGAVVVTRGQTVIGIFTERDVLNRVVAAEKAPADTLVREVMTSPVACCRPDTPLDECRSVMRNKRIRHLPVVAEDRLVGIISIGDLNEDERATQDETIYWLNEYMYGNYR
ncbi:MAG: Inosine-5'-monophosphate dehydrogenase [Phycisphaerae bacterium]|nr:Inosine-5'-monophosphate dehydrogenase [Phycisphaerae bacterium]